ncbi:MAG: LptE family protein [Bdellovibrionales bacterium]|nr:LPS assembly lipoprotein LptE [Bdellovibrionales bacterium]NQZ18706.1 LptE family protein [Bdellovibrionales bacterium]
MKLLAFLALLSLSACAYNIGYANRSLPGGHKTVFVQMFDNTSEQVGAEPVFTQALMSELQRSGFVTVTDKNSAELIISGTILTANSAGTASVPTFYKTDHANQTAYSYNASMFLEYLLTVSANVQAKRSRDDKVIWQTYLQHQKNYRGSQIKKDGLRSSNALYNQSAKKQTMKLVAREMMAEVFDRLTENF